MREREGGRERGREKEGEREKERQRERERERESILCVCKSLLIARKLKLSHNYLVSTFYKLL